MTGKESIEKVRGNDTSLVVRHVEKLIGQNAKMIEKKGKVISDSVERDAKMSVSKHWITT